MRRRTYSFDVDVTGSCNLRCPCCPQGNSGRDRLPHGFMEPELLAAIVRKAVSECRVSAISLFNWAEPLLHPGLPELIRIVQGAGIPCHLSSNLNLLPDADAIMAAHPASFKISVSGFTQEVYAVTHRGGDVDRVKQNMELLAAAKKRSRAATRIFVTYHRYRHNLQEELMMRDFALRLGFGFEPVWALMFPLEKLLACADGAPADPQLTAADRALIDLLAYPLEKTLLAARTAKEQPCRLRDRQISLDFQGNVLLCCGIFDNRSYTIGSYLLQPLAAIQELRSRNPFCSRCLQNGLQAFLTYQVPEMEQYVLETVTPEEIALLDLREEMRTKQRQREIAGRTAEVVARLIGKITQGITGKKH